MQISAPAQGHPWYRRWLEAGLFSARNSLQIVAGGTVIAAAFVLLTVASRDFLSSTTSLQAWLLVLMSGVLTLSGLYIALGTAFTNWIEIGAIGTSFVAVAGVAIGAARTPTDLAITLVLQIAITLILFALVASTVAEWVHVRFSAWYATSRFHQASLASKAREAARRARRKRLQPYLPANFRDTITLSVLILFGMIFVFAFVALQYDWRTAGCIWAMGVGIWFMGWAVASNRFVKQSLKQAEQRESAALAVEGMKRALVEQYEDSQP